MHMCFICAVGNKAVLTTIFKIPQGNLTFGMAIQIATSTEDAARVTKEIVYGSAKELVYKVRENRHHNSQAQTPCWNCWKEQERELLLL